MGSLRSVHSILSQLRTEIICDECGESTPDFSPKTSITVRICTKSVLAVITYSTAEMQPYEQRVYQTSLGRENHTLDHLKSHPSWDTPNGGPHKSDTAPSGSLEAGIGYRF